MPASVAPPRVAIVTLGCGRNEVDSEQLAGLLADGGYEVVEDAATAEAVLVNTCTFVGPATRESIDTVLAACDLKTSAAARAVLVVGCLAQRHAHELADAVPEADAVVGFGGYAQLAGLVDAVLAGRPVPRVVGVDAPDPRADAEAPRPRLPLVVAPAARVPGDAPVGPAPASGPRFPPRRRTTVDGRTTPWAYLGIASGCDRTCTFCAIPSFRGRFRSRPLDELVAEARWLAGEGVRELVLVSENTTAWGKDLPGGRDGQAAMVHALASVEGIARLRLLYLQPAELTDGLVAAMLDDPRVAPYFDLSLQHASGPVVRRMARSGDHERFLALIEGIRARRPDAVFRSNFILGFPGETEADVEVLEAFLLDARIDWVGLFPFSPEDGTPAATMPDQVPAEVAHARVERIRSLQERVADAAARTFVGRELDVLVELDPDGVVVGRSHREGPDGDGEVRLVTTDGTVPDLSSGRMVRARVVATDGVDLVAEVVG